MNTKKRYKAFCAWVRNEISMRKINQTKLAEYLNITQSGLSKRIRGQNEWSFKEVLEVLEYFETDFEDIL